MIETELRPTSKDLATIKLQGYPYCQIRDGDVVDCSSVLENLAWNVDYRNSLIEKVQDNLENLQPLLEGGYYALDAKLKAGKSLSYEEAFGLITFVSMGLNTAVHDLVSPMVQVGITDQETVRLQSVSLLSNLSMKESIFGLCPDEIAGLTAATLEIDTIVRVSCPEGVIGVGGMGGDRGYPKNGENSKLFSLSTMGAIVASDTAYVHKHHSYPNTSRVAGQSAIEFLGARSDQSSLEALSSLQVEAGLLMSSCHTTRLIHNLSHRLKGETINHIVGPLSLPIDKDTPVSAFIGVNHNVHPETVIETLRILQSKGVQKYQNCVAFCGLNCTDPKAELMSTHTYYQCEEAKAQVAIDEVAPPSYPTLASFLVSGENRGSFLIEPEDFMDEDLIGNVRYEDLIIHNTEEAILGANEKALKGEDTSKSLYLAMTAGLAIFTKNYLHLPDALNDDTRRVNNQYLKEATGLALDSIYSQRAYLKLQQYINISKKYCGVR